MAESITGVIFYHFTRTDTQILRFQHHLLPVSRIRLEQFTNGSHMTKLGFVTQKKLCSSLRACKKVSNLQFFGAKKRGTGVCYSFELF